MSKIIVKAHPETGAIMTSNTNKADWSTVRLEETKFVNSGRIINKQTRVAFVTGPNEILNEMGLKANQPYPVDGKLVVKESLEPFYEGQTAKKAGNTDVTCTKNGQPIYRTTEFTTDLTEPDVFVAHDNSEEIKAAQAAVAQVGVIGEE